jgi:HPt (histidine-containing phosphotransfer) domain-containing protein
MAEIPVLDPASLAALRAISPEDGGAFLHELFNIFLADTPGRITEIETSTAAQDAKTLTRAAHSIKGAAGNFGAHHLCEIARQIETFGKDSDFAGARAALPQLIAAFADVKLAMEQFRVE